MVTDRDHGLVGKRELWQPADNRATPRAARRNPGDRNPRLPVDLGSLGDSVATVTQGVTDTAAGSLDSLTAVGDQIAGAAACVTENVSDIPATIDSATQAVPTVTEALQAGANTSN